MRRLTRNFGEQGGAVVRQQQQQQQQLLLPFSLQNKLQRRKGNYKGVMASLITVKANKGRKPW